MSRSTSLLRSDIRIKIFEALIISHMHATCTAHLIFSLNTFETIGEMHKLQSFYLLTYLITYLLLGAVYSFES